YIKYPENKPAKKEISSIISHVPQYGHLLCSPCCSVVPYKTLHYHLRHYHKIRTSFCTAIVSQYKGLAVSQTDADVIPLPGGSSPLEFLVSPRRGYFCPYCDYTTYSWDVLLRHFRETQCRRERKACDDLSCSVQGWAFFGRNVRKTWRVNGDTAIGQHEAKARPGWHQSALDDPATVALLQMEDKEEARLL
ncbi:hypothetical protein BU25DRAFT_254149, partial [Macroventuria anomochaeta]